MLLLQIQFIPALALRPPDVHGMFAHFADTLWRSLAVCFLFFGYVATAVALLSIQYAGNAKFSKQNKHTICEQDSISSSWTAAFIPCNECKRLPVGS